MTVTTRPTRKTRSARPAPETGSGLRGWLWASGQLIVLGVEVLALLFLLANPAFRPRAIQVVGSTHLDAQQVVAAMGMPPDRSIFLLDHSVLETRLRALPWVRSASVALTLPDHVQVRIDEWIPVAVLQQGERSFFLNAQGRILGPAPEAGSLPIVQRPALASTQAGTAVVSPELEALLIPMSSGFRGAYHMRIVAFFLDDRQGLSVKTDRGFVIYFGQMATANERATLEPKLAALKALASRIDLVSSPITYVNLMNPAAPAVQMRPGR
jgi:cell division septal protein FtsQ